MIHVIGNQKGGCGKTTTAVNLAVESALAGKETLLIDMDPQANTTLTFLEPDDKRLDMHDLLTGVTSTYGTMVQVPEYKKLWLLPSSINLARLEMHNGQGLDIIYSLKEKLAEVKETYDMIFIDTGPTLGILSVMAMIAADTIIIPIQASYYALQGTTDLLNTYRMVKKNLNKELDLLGVIITMYAKTTNISKEAAEEIRESFGEKVFSTVISRRVVLEESPACGKGISTYRPKSDSAREYRALYEEVISRGR